MMQGIDSFRREGGPQLIGGVFDKVAKRCLRVRLFFERDVTVLYCRTDG